MSDYNSEYKRIVENNTQNQQKRHISNYGAELLVSSINKAHQGYSPVALFEALALNLGIKELGTVGEKVIFSTAMYEDTYGGLLNGDKAKVVQVGWKLFDKIVGKIKVVPINN